MGERVAGDDEVDDVVGDVVAAGAEVSELADLEVGEGVGVSPNTPHDLHEEQQALAQVGAVYTA